MEALLINGSPRVGGNTARALKEIENVLTQEGIHVTTVQVGTHDISGCTACSCCGKMARNAVFLMKSIALGKQEYGLPEAEKKVRANFVR